MTINDMRISKLIAKREKFIAYRDGFKLASDNARAIVDTYSDLSYEQKLYYEGNYHQGLSISKFYQEKIDDVEQKLLKLGFAVKSADDAAVDDEKTIG